MLAGILFYVGELHLKQDNADTRSNLSQIYKRLEQYHTEHGAYPPQQDMKSLLKTLGMNEDDFFEVFFFDINTAEYHASNRNQEYSDQNMDDPVLSIRVKSRIFGKYERLCVRKDGSVYRDFDTGATP
jgi:predicted ATP-dependent endonuclease of OLD family